MSGSLTRVKLTVCSVFIITNYPPGGGGHLLLYIDHNRATRRAQPCQAGQHAGSVWSLRLRLHVPPLNSQVSQAILMTSFPYRVYLPAPGSVLWCFSIQKFQETLCVEFPSSSLVTPVRTKSKIPAILGLDFVVIAAFYLLVSLTGIFAFGRVTNHSLEVLDEIFLLLLLLKKYFYFYYY